MWENSIFFYCQSQDAHHINLSHPKSDYDILGHLILMPSNLLLQWSRVIPLSSPRLPLYASYWTKVDCFLLQRKGGLQNKHWHQFNTLAPFFSCVFLVAITFKEAPSDLGGFLFLIACWSLLLFPLANQVVIQPLCYQTSLWGLIGPRGAGRLALPQHQ